jgi:tetratricopeptide (TPR) repeat protein
MAKGDTAETIRLATEGARKPGPTQVGYFELLGNAYDAEHRTREAVEAFKRGTKVDPSYAPIHFNLGLTYGGQKKFKDASPQFAVA